jgi:hypothetical protein
MTRGTVQHQTAAIATLVLDEMRTVWTFLGWLPR